MKRNRWIAILLIICLAIGAMAGCKSETKKSAAVAGDYVEGESGTGENATIVENQGGGMDNDQSDEGQPDIDVAPDTDDDQKQPEDTDKDNNVKPDNGNNKKPDADNGNNKKPDADNGTAKPDDGKDDTKPDTDTKPDDTKPDDTKPDNTKPSDEEEEEEEESDVKYKDGNKIKILDYNLRCANDPEGRSIKERSVRFREVMKKYQPDVCGFQEIVPEWVTYLAADYPDYGHHIEYRSTSSKEGTMVMWNTKTMEELEHGHFWLSDTPDTMSKADSWGETQFYRIVAWAKVKVKATGSTFIYYSTHQNNSGTHPEGSAKVILAQAKKMGVGTKFGGFCMGDYNIEPWTKGYVAMINNGEGPFNDINADLDNLSDVTNHGYHNSDNPHIIDYIFYTPAKVAPLHYEVVDMEIDGNYVSDHRGLYAEAALLY